VAAAATAAAAAAAVVVQRDISAITESVSASGAVLQTRVHGCDSQH
jgi:hypothetical protein